MCVVMGEMKRIYTEMKNHEEMILKKMIVGLGIYDTDVEIIQKKMKKKNATITVITNNENNYDRVIELEVDNETVEVWKIEMVFEHEDFERVTATMKIRRIR